MRDGAKPRRPLPLLAASLLLMLAACTGQDAGGGPWSLAVHGGARNAAPEELTPEETEARAAAMQEALRVGGRILQDGGAALDAVQAAIVVLEDSPYFNAGKGAVFTHEGNHELDASIMDGATLKAGAAAGVTGVRNPILLARRVMDHSPHVMLTASGAEAFARAQGLAFEPTGYFYTDRNWKALREAIEKERAGEQSAREAYFGTVGAVALDRQGHLAAGTSTGGMTNKRHGRVGDSPVIGAGTYAQDGQCAVSATGHGEYFIRLSVAHEICARVRLAGQSIRKAADGVILKDLAALGGTGGVIAMDADGKLAMPFNTSVMYRGAWREGGEPVVAANPGNP